MGLTFSNDSSHDLVRGQLHAPLRRPGSPGSLEVSLNDSICGGVSNEITRVRDVCPSTNLLGIVLWKRSHPSGTNTYTDLAMTNNERLNILDGKKVKAFWMSTSYDLKRFTHCQLIHIQINTSILLNI